MMKLYFWIKTNYQNIIAILFLVFVLLFFLWTASSNTEPFVFKYPMNNPEDHVEGGYYNALSDAFLKGQLNLTYVPRQELLQLSDPYDPSLNAPFRLHDLSLFNGHYYMYWGPVPAIILYIPVRLFGLGHMPDTLAVVLFAFGGVIFNVLLLSFIRSRYFKDTSFLLFFPSIVAVSLCTTLPYLFRRIAVYEVAITAGYFFLFCAMFLLITGALEPGKYQYPKFMLGSLLLGFAVGSRYPLFFAALLLPAAWFLQVKGLYLPLKEQVIQSWKTITCLSVPFLSCIFFLGLYNYLRFGSWFDFGLKYVLAGVNAHSLTSFFALENLPNGLYFYFFKMYSVNRYFPFYYLDRAIPSYLSPPSYYGLEPLAGIFLFLPTLFLLFSIPIMYKKIFAFNKEYLIVLTSILSIGIINLIIDSLSPVATMRYEVDFLPLFVLATGILIFYLADKISQKKSFILNMIFTCFILDAVLWGAAFNVGIGFTGYYDNFKGQNPGLYYSIAREFWDFSPGWDPEKNGPVTMKIMFPSNRIMNGMGEPIVVTGQTNQGDILFVKYETNNSILFGIDHWGMPPVYSNRTTIIPGAQYNLTVNMGSLYQPVTEGLYPDSSRWCFIQFNDETLLSRYIFFFPSDPENVTIGINNIGGTTTIHEFSGVITNIHRSAFY